MLFEGRMHQALTMMGLTADEGLELQEKAITMVSREHGRSGTTGVGQASVLKQNST